LFADFPGAAFQKRSGKLLISNNIFIMRSHGRGRNGLICLSLAWRSTRN
jgi:hypothetical protein